MRTFLIGVLTGAHLLPGGVLAQPPGATIREIQSRAAAEPFEGSMVSTQGVVTWTDSPPGRQFYIQDSTGGVRVTAVGRTLPVVGTFVDVRGTLTRGPFSPIIADATIDMLGQRGLPAPMQASAGGLLNGAFNGERVELNGWVRSAEMATPDTLVAVLSSGSARITAQISNAAGMDPAKLIGTQIRVRGVASPVKARGALRQLVEVQILVRSQADVHSFYHRETGDPWKSPIVPLRGVFQYRPGQTRGDRIRVRGQVVHQKDGMTYLNDGESGLAVRGVRPSKFARGDWVEALGFLDLEEFLPVLSDAEFAPAEPGSVSATPHEISAEKILGDGLQHANYVTVTGHLLDRMETSRAAAGSTLTLALQSPRGVFTAELNTMEPGPVLPKLEIGSTIRVTGVCLVQTDAAGNPSGFRVLVPSPEQIAIVKPASFFTVKRLLVLLSIALAVLLVVTLLAYVFARRNVGLLAEMSERKAITAERTRLARDLHDTLEQGLTGIHLHLHSIGPTADDASLETQERLGVLRSLVHQCHAEIRRSIWALRAGALEHFDLGEALERSARSLSLGSGTKVRVRQRRTVVKIPPLIEDNLLRIGQEVITNAAKHAHASLIDIDIVVTTDAVSLTVSDNGQGFDPSAPRPDGHFGLDGIRERAARIGGRLTVTSSPSRGATIRIEVPLPSPATPV